MDNNLNPSQPSSSPTTPPTGVPASNAPSSFIHQPSFSSKGNNKIILISILMIVLLAVMGGVGYYFMMMQTSKTKTPQQTPKTVETKDELQTQLNQIKAEEDISPDFSDVDKDLQIL